MNSQPTATNSFARVRFLLASTATFVVAAVVSDGVSLLSPVSSDAEWLSRHMTPASVFGAFVASATWSILVAFTTYATAFLVAVAVTSLSARIGVSPARLVPAVLSAPLAVAVWYLLGELLAGQHVSQLPYAKPIGHAALPLSYLAGWWLIATAVKLNAGVLTRGRRLVFGFLAVGALVASLVIDAAAYRLRYPQAHELLWIVAAGMCLLIGAELARRGRPRGRVLVALISGAVLVASTFLVLQPLAHSADNRITALYRTQFMSLVLRIAYASEDAGADADPELLALLTAQEPLAEPMRSTLLKNGQQTTVVLSVDALRFDCLGSGLTPNIDRFAESTIRFDRAWTTYPLTFGAFLSTFRGIYPHKNIIEETPSTDDPMPRSAPVAELARQQGWRTVAISGFPLFLRRAFAALFNGFEETEWLGSFEFHPPAEQVANRALEILEQPGPRPLLMWVHCFDPHTPEREPGDTARERYDAAVRRVDTALGPLLEKLQSEPVNVIFMADHGKVFHGRAYDPVGIVEELLHIPLLMKIPGATPHTVEGPVDLSSVAPTLLQILGIPIHPEVQSPSLFTRLDGVATARPFVAMSAFWEHSIATRVRAFRTPQGVMVEDFWAHEQIFGRLSDGRWTDADLDPDSREELQRLADVHRELIRITVAGMNR